MEELINNVEQWSDNKGITDKSSPEVQWMKVIEELGELSKAISESREDDMVDGFGDVLVTLIIENYLLRKSGKLKENQTVEHCLGVAYDVIKDRDGEIVDGMFIKEERINNYEHPLYTGRTNNG